MSLVKFTDREASRPEFDVILAGGGCSITARPLYGIIGGDRSKPLA